MEKQQPNRAANPNRRDAEVPGHVYNRLNEYKPPLASRFSEVQVHNKAVRMLAARLGGMSLEGFNSLVIVGTYLSLFERSAENRDFIIDWSGAHNPWKRKVSKGIAKAIEEGNLIETGRQGKSLELTERGSKILQDYNNIFEEAKQIYIDKAAKKLNAIKLKRKQATESRKR